MSNYIKDPDLMQVLKSGDKDDLDIIIDIITSNGEGRLSLDDTVKDSLVAARDSKAVSNPIMLKIGAEIQKYGGNSVINLFRGGKGVPYREIATDVAKHLRANFKADHDIAEIESAILLKVVEKSLEKMSEKEKKEFFDEFGVHYRGAAGPAAMLALQTAILAGGFASYQLALVAANGVARAIVGRGLALGANAGLTRGIGIFAGPIGWAITAVWTAFDLASPAYRITVPCVIQIAYMRQKGMLKICSKCRAPISSSAKFCSKCGAKASGSGKKK